MLQMHPQWHSDYVGKVRIRQANRQMEMGSQN
jgi:hypothetical protein